MKVWKTSFLSFPCCWLDLLMSYCQSPVMHKSWHISALFPVEPVHCPLVGRFAITQVMCEEHFWEGSCLSENMLPCTGSPQSFKGIPSSLLDIRHGLLRILKQNSDGCILQIDHRKAGRVKAHPGFSLTQVYRDDGGEGLRYNCQLISCFCVSSATCFEMTDKAPVMNMFTQYMDTWRLIYRIWLKLAGRRRSFKI